MCIRDSTSTTASKNLDKTAVITANNSEPQNPLIPTNTNETGGGKIVDSLFAGLVYYDAKGKPVNEVADSTFTVKLKQPEADFPLRLGYTAFFPLPQAAYADIKTFGENPIGDGPYKFAS